MDTDLQKKKKNSIRVTAQSKYVTGAFTNSNT